jgi:hypothetical protein
MKGGYKDQKVIKAIWKQRTSNHNLKQQTMNDKQQTTTNRQQATYQQEGDKTCCPK